MHVRLLFFPCKTEKRNQNISMYYFVTQNVKTIERRTAQKIVNKMIAEKNGQ